MRRLFSFQMVSLDGYFEGPNHDLSWHVVDQEFNRFAVAQLRKIGTLLFGRLTYQLFEEFWPKAERDSTMSSEILEIARMINSVDKIVFSKTLANVKEMENWKNIKLVREIKAEEISHLKRESERDVAIFGSNNLATQLLETGLVDELRIMVNPVIVGTGNVLFKGLKNRVKLKLANTKMFKSGNVLHYYQPVEK